MKNEVIVAYLFSGFENKENLYNFIKHYKKYRSGYKHRLLICFKLIDNKKINELRKILKKIKHIEFLDPCRINDFDFGTYGRVAELNKNKVIFFMNGYSYPVKKNWLKIIMKYYKKKTIIGCTGSYESQLSSLKIKKFYKIFNYIKKYLFYKKNFNLFPNPHIRTANFLINGNDFNSFNIKKIYKKKSDAWASESGKNGLTHFFKRKKFKIFVINSDAKMFTEREWMLSETYCYKNQNKLLISDKHTRKFQNLSKIGKLCCKNKVWFNQS
jgi:hypothetical protein